MTVSDKRMYHLSTADTISRKGPIANSNDCFQLTVILDAPCCFTLHALRTTVKQRVVQDELDIHRSHNKNEQSVDCRWH
jgi:hypothetical protein